MLFFSSMEVRSLSTQIYVYVITVIFNLNINLEFRNRTNSNGIGKRGWYNCLRACLRSVTCDTDLRAIVCSVGMLV